MTPTVQGIENHLHKALRRFEEDSHVSVRFDIFGTEFGLGSKARDAMLRAMAVELHRGLLHLAKMQMLAAEGPPPIRSEAEILRLKGALEVSRREVDRLEPDSHMKLVGIRADLIILDWVLGLCSDEIVYPTNKTPPAEAEGISLTHPLGTRPAKDGTSSL